MDSPEPAKPDEVIDLALDAPEPEPVFLDLDEPAVAASPGMPASSVPGKPGRPRWQWAAAGAVALVLAFGATVGAVAVFSGNSSLEELRASDPEGAKACEGLTYWLDGNLIDPKTRQPYDSLTAGMSLADWAAASTTPGIKATASEDVMAGESGRLLRQYGGPSGSMRFLNTEKLHAACVEAGVDMPAYTDKPKAA